MKTFVKLLVISTLIISCKSQPIKVMEKQLVLVENVLQQDQLSIRALVTDVKEKRVWFVGTKGYVGFYDVNKQKVDKIQLIFNELYPHFRSIGQTSSKVFVLSIESPGLLFSIDKQNLSNKVVYQDQREGCFFDTMQFWNDFDGIAIGDPIDGVFNVIITKDGGKTWSRISNLPKAFEGEAHFAASNSCVAIYQNQVWIFTGGKQARVFYSKDKGNTWEAYETPIIAGKTMTGIFTGHFYNDKIGCIAGGDYENQEADNNNIAFTIDGGKTWEIKKTKVNLGYTSCVQYLPSGKGLKMVAVAAKGLYYSDDSGNSWTLLHDEPDFYTITFVDKTTAIMAGKNKIVKITFLN